MLSSEVLSGSCLCGSVRYQATTTHSPMWYCHCQQCRKASGVAFASWIAASEDQFQWLSGGEKIVSYSSSAYLQRCFCSCCGTVLPARDTANSTRWLPAGGVQSELCLRPQYHQYTQSKAPWFGSDDGLPCYAAAREQGNPVAAPTVVAVNHEGQGTAQGSCLCGAVAYRLAAPLEVMRSCHCSRCRCASGSAYFVGLPGLAANLEYRCGEELLSDYHLPESRYYDRRFCSRCGSNMPGKLPGIERTMAAAGSLDTDPGERISYHVFAGSQADWYAVDDGLPQFETYPPEDYSPE
jgi:hypothetical protein